MSKDNREECPDCKGTGVDYCNYTHPKGWTVCLKCKRCKTCNGTGEVTIDSGTDVKWIPIEKVLDIIQLSKDGKWNWGSTEGMRGKYLNIRIDMRDGHCLVKDRDDNKIDIDKLKKDGLEWNNKKEF